MKEFYKTIRWKMTVPAGLTGLAGGIIMPANIPLHTLERRAIDKRYPHMARRLLDPQLYLLGLNPTASRNVCANLASYPWFPVRNPEPYDSGQHGTQATWKKDLKAKIHEVWSGTAPVDDNEIDEAISKCLGVQAAIGVEALILPTPLTAAPHSSYEVELNWLDRGLSQARRLFPDLPSYASVALSDSALRGEDPWNNRLLDVIIDQLTARRLSHVYIVLEQANENGYFCTHFNTVGALLRLTDGLKCGGVGRVFISFAGSAGLLALAAGADAWSTGWFLGERRLRLSDLEDKEGRAHPTYYSQPLASEFHLERDLDQAVAAGLLRRIADETPASRGLLLALNAGRSSNDVPEWRYSQSNTAAAIEHFLTACIRETQRLDGMGPDVAIEATAEWLAGATRLASDLYAAGPLNRRTSVDHQPAWRNAFESYRRNKL